MEKGLSKIERTGAHWGAGSSEVDGDSRFRWWWLVMFAGLCAIATITWVGSPAPIFYVGHDVPILLDGAWRTWQGQRQGVDFNGGPGEVMYWTVDVGFLLVGPCVKAIAIGGFVWLFAAGSLTYAIAIRRMPALLAVICAAFVGLLAVAPYALGFDPRGTTYAELYNRYALCLLSIILVEGYLPPRDAIERQHRPLDWTAAAAGACAAMIFFVKLPYDAAALAIVVASCFLVRFSLKRFASLAVGFIAIFVILGYRMILNPRPVIESISATFGAKAAEKPLAEVLASKFAPSFVPFALFILMAIVQAVGAAMVRRADGASNVRRARSPGRLTYTGVVPVLAALAVVVASYGCLLTSAQSTECPLLVAGALTVLAWYLRATRNAGRKANALRNRFTVALVLLGLAVGGRIVWRQIESLVFAAKWRLDHGPGAPADVRINAAPLQDFVVYHAGGTWTTDYPSQLNEGIELLRRHAGPRDGVMTMDFSDPFNFALGLRSPRGAALCWEYQNNFDLKHHLPPETLFAEPTFILMPSLLDNIAGYWQYLIYGPYIESHFHDLEVGHWWTLLVRNDRLPATATTQPATLPE